MASQDIASLPQAATPALPAIRKIGTDDLIDALRRGLVVARPGEEARADRDVALVVVHHLEHAPQLGRRVLAVGVEPAAEAVAARGRLAVALGDPVPQAVVGREAHDFGAARNDCGGYGMSKILPKCLLARMCSWAALASRWMRWK